jgi:hypothetical protein
MREGRREGGGLLTAEETSMGARMQMSFPLLLLVCRCPFCSNESRESEEVRGKAPMGVSNDGGRRSLLTVTVSF